MIRRAIAVAGPAALADKRAVRLKYGYAKGRAGDCE